MSRLRVVFVSVVALAIPMAATALTFEVPADYGTIQSAIGVASPSRIDTVLVAPGLYRERLNIINKNLVLRGKMGASVTTLDGNRGGNVITMRGVGRDCVIEDMTITGGWASNPESVGTAIYLNQYASPTVQRCRLVGNAARAGGGLKGYVHCEPVIRDCWIAHNNGGGVDIELGPGPNIFAQIENTVIVQNNGSGVFAWKGAQVKVLNCTIAHNTTDGVRTREQGLITMERSIVAHNAGAGVIRLDNTGCFTLRCNDVFGNQQGQWVNYNSQDPCFSGRGSGDVSYEPCFQNADLDNFHLQQMSPLCQLREGPCGVLGAYEDLCGPPGVPCVVAVQASTWTHVKTIFR